MNVNERKMTWTGILTWILIGIPAVLSEVDHHSIFTLRAAMLFAAFALFLAGFLIATRHSCADTLRIPLIVLETLAAFACAFLQPTGFLPVMLVIVAAQLGGYPPRVSISAIALNSLILGFIVNRTGGPGVTFALVYFAFSLFA